MRLPSSMITAVLGTFLTVAHAEAPADFTGSWKIDPAQSQSLDELFKIQELSWIERKAAGNFDDEAKIEQEDGRLIVQYDNLLGTHRQVLVFDGKPHKTVNPAGVATTFSTAWSEAVLVATGRLVFSDGVKGTLSEHRSLSADGTVMTVRVKIKRDDGPSASARRTYKRQ